MSHEHVSEEQQTFSSSTMSRIFSMRILDINSVLHSEAETGARTPATGGNAGRRRSEQVPSAWQMCGPATRRRLLLRPTRGHLGRGRSRQRPPHTHWHEPREGRQRSYGSHATRAGGALPGARACRRFVRLDRRSQNKNVWKVCLCAN